MARNKPKAKKKSGSAPKAKPATQSAKPAAKPKPAAPKAKPAAQSAKPAAKKAKPAAKKAKPSATRKKASPYMAELREIADFCKENGLTEFEFENEKIRVRLSKVAGIALAQPAAPAYAAPVAPAAPQAATVEAATPAAEVAPADDGVHKITSPIVGTFYRAPGPDKDPFVKEGSKVTAESTVCIVEAMKLMNEIQAEVAGEIVAVYVENGQPVEFGQPLFGVRK
jgi:acetyl-CoA carboxylase biotin carboxyl carrier protein